MLLRPCQDFVIGNVEGSNTLHATPVGIVDFVVSQQDHAPYRGSTNPTQQSLRVQAIKITRERTAGQFHLAKHKAGKQAMRPAETNPASAAGAAVSHPMHVSINCQRFHARGANVKIPLPFVDHPLQNLPMTTLNSLHIGRKAFRYAEIFLLGLATLATHAAAPDPFAENVRTTEPLTPAEQQKTFHLPAGFSIELVASEPQIAKPMNMAFDARGRLWVTTSYEYPFPKKPGEPARDSIKIFESTRQDGHYDKATTFVDNLNIPIAVLPYGDGCIAWSIPNIYYFRDTDGDGRADRRDVVFGPLGWERDTHGNIASFRRGNDGWIYGTHGFNNNSTFKASDGSSISLNSGNTYRFRPDGSHVDQFTWGQVNPFGMCMDERGYFYTADCHSSPIYQLVPGGYYPSFGKPDDGLGFAPTTIQHSHGSTAIAGILIVPEQGWPADLQGNIFIGNVMTSRINRDRVEWHGSSPVGIEMPDFLSTDDPWFRPVDIQLGPDGALYIADFYNRIIGHYEVPLQHPGRDRQRGRIWRVRYNGASPSPLPDLTQATATVLVTELGSGIPARRQLALQELVDRVGVPASSLVRGVLVDAKSSAAQRVGALWVLHRLGQLDPEILREALTHSAPLVRMHAARIVGADPEPRAAFLSSVDLLLEDKDPHVRRAAAEAIALHPGVQHIDSLLKARDRVASDDSHLLYTLKVALRNQFKAPGAFEFFLKRPAIEATWKQIAEGALSISSPESSAFLLEHVRRFHESPEVVVRVLKQAARSTPETQVSELAEFAKQATAKDLGQQFDLYQAVKQGLAERSIALPAVMRSWSTELVDGLLSTAARGAGGWENVPWENAKDTGNPWTFQDRRTTDGKTVRMLSSLPDGGEALTGTLRSPEFLVPATLRFLASGHDGYPDKPAQHQNRIRLRETGTDVVLMETFAPRNDVAQTIQWDLGAHRGKRARLEVVDQNAEAAYAWLAIGGLDPTLIPFPTIAPRDVATRIRGLSELAESADLSALNAKLVAWTRDAGTEIQIASAAARVLTARAKSEGLAALGALADEPLLGADLRRSLCAAMGQMNATRVLDVVVEVLKQASSRTQVRVAEVMAGHPVLAAHLIDWVEQSKANAALLVESKVGGKLSATLPMQKERIARLTAQAPKVDAKLQALIDERRSGFAAARPDLARGAAVFTQNCAVCHRLGGLGNLVGPQLDGIGSRGLDRLCEDILDPNRNVDRAFRAQLIVQNDGEVVTGLPRREAGDLLVFANSAGQEFSIAKSTVKERRDSALSLMPENFGEIVTPQDFYHLLGYLSQQRTAQAK